MNQINNSKLNPQLVEGNNMIRADINQRTENNRYTTKLKSDSLKTSTELTNLYQNRQRERIQITKLRSKWGYYYNSYRNKNNCRKIV